MSVCYMIHWKPSDIQWNTTIKADQHLTLLKNLTYKPQHIFSKCTFHGIEYPCDEKFWSSSVTNKGVCYTFNGLNTTDIYKDIV